MYKVNGIYGKVAFQSLHSFSKIKAKRLYQGGDRMGKQKRHWKIKELINSHNIETQEQLVEHLRKAGFQVTQATVSRDIKELQLVKVLTDSGRYKYSLPPEKKYDPALKLQRVLEDTLVKIDQADNLVVLKTIPGNAHAVGAIIDQLDWQEIVGTICGDDTCLIISRSHDDAKRILSRFSERRLKIKEIIANHPVETQEELIKHLESEGIEVTQATISRDMKELHLVKQPGKDGHYQYGFSPLQQNHVTEMLRKALHDAILKIDQAENLIVLKTLPGNAHALGVLLDQLDWSEIVGTICGDDTCLIVARTGSVTKKITERLYSLISTAREG